MNGHRQTAPACPFGAKLGSGRYLFDPLSALANSVAGTVSPSVFAVLRLTDNSNLRHLVENARDFHAAAEIGHLGFEPQRRQPLRHRFHVAADTERPARALQEDGANLVILARPPCRFHQAPHHVRIERVAPVRVVHGDREQALVEVFAGRCS